MIAPPLFILAFMLAPAESLELAARSHEAGNYEFAALLYDLLDDGRQRSAAFHDAQGNAHFLAGNLPQAIRAYHRGLRLRPREKTLVANLTDARARVSQSLGTESFRSWREIAREMAWPVAVIWWLLGWLLVIAWIRRPGRRRLVMAGVVWSLSLGLLALSWFLTASERPFAVVAEDGVVLRRGNGLSYEEVVAAGELVRLNRGMEARVLTTRPNGWAQLRLANGVTGWAPVEQLLMNPSR